MQVQRRARIDWSKSALQKDMNYDTEKEDLEVDCNTAS